MKAAASESFGYNEDQIVSSDVIGMRYASYEYDALSGSTYTYGYAYTATPLFTGKGKFVCEGYSKAMKILCGKFGINCALVSGDGMTSASSGGPHMWNYVQIGDKWYAVDSTLHCNQPSGLTCQ